MNSNSKGGSFERWVAKSFSLWMTDGKRNDLLWRTAMSGGRATLQRKRGINNIAQVGDISAIDPEGLRLTKHFVVECKHRNDLNLFGGLALGRGRLFKYWEKLCEEAEATESRHPLLIACENRQPTLLLTNFHGFGVLQLQDLLVAELHGDWKHAPVYVALFEKMIQAECPL